MKAKLGNKGYFYILAAVVMLIFLGWGIKQNYTRLTYLESYESAIDISNPVVLETRDSIMEKSFTAPYELLDSVSIWTGTFGRNNNSNWIFEIVDSNNQVVCSDSMNASQFQDGAYTTIKFDNNIKVNKGDEYTLRVHSEDVAPGSIVQFWCDSNDTLVMMIHGSDFDFWWVGFFVFEWLVVLGALIRAFIVQAKGKKILDDSIFKALILGIVFFILKSSFALVDTFLDEYDNLVGGITVAQGGVIYREYITQHTPFLYYLCSIFALLSADSVEQFRLCYYVFEALAWSLIYLRNKNQIGAKKAFILPIASVVILSTIAGDMGVQVLSDNVQGLCFVALLLELYNYLKTRIIDWKRSIIVSLCLWISFGSAFVSAFSLAWIVICVILAEALSVKLKIKTTKDMLIGFGKLLVASIIPPILAGIYFYMNGCLMDAYRQAYVFNREVYPLYSGGYGESMFSPILDSFRFYALEVSGDFISIFSGSLDLNTLVRMLVLIIPTACIIALIARRKYACALVSFMVAICAASRGYGFHSMAAYYVFVMIMVVFFDELEINFKSNIRNVILTSFVCILLSSNFVASSVENLKREIAPVDSLSLRIVLYTEEGEKIFMDEDLVNPLYVLSKGRVVVNRQAYLLPWAMDMFEQECIDDLLVNSPNYVIYDENHSAWEVPYGQNRFLDLLQRDYQRMSDDPNVGWPYLVWVRK